MKLNNFYKLTITSCFLFLFSCGHGIQTAQRTELATTTHSTEALTRTDVPAEIDLKLTDEQLQKYAYELGYDPDKGLTPEERIAAKQRRRVRELERTLDSDKEKNHYSKVLPLLENDQEKIDYLSLKSIEGRQAWVNRKKIWSRLKSDKDFQDVLASQDIAVGMTAELVKKSWGSPSDIEYSGNQIYKNERWKYVKEVPSPNGYKQERLYVYFEGGRVVGWETE